MIASIFNKTFAWWKSILYFAWNPGLKALEITSYTAWPIQPDLTHSRSNWPRCLAGGFYYLQFRISLEIYSEPFEICIQWFTLIRVQMLSYGVKLRFFDTPQQDLKMLLDPLSHRSVQENFRAFQRGIKSLFWSISFKLTGPWSWRSKKIGDILGSRLFS